MKLELLEIPQPCSVAWETMRGDDRVRHCLQCHLDVYDLSAMTREEAERVVAQNEGQVCVTFWKRADGTVLTQDCEPLRADPRPCTPASGAFAAAPAPMMVARPAAPPAPAPSRAARPEDVTGSPDGDPPPPTTPPPPRPVAPPVVRMAGAPMPVPRPSLWEEVDPRLARDTVLAELVRAVRASLEDAEARVREIEKALDVPDSHRAASCPQRGCPLWIAEVNAAPDTLKRADLVKAVRDAVESAFDSKRSATLLRELLRTTFGTRIGYGGRCPHCSAWISAPRDAVAPPRSP